MGIQPNSRAEKIQLFETLLPLWTANAVSIGLASTEVTSFGTKVTTARASFTAAETARNASRSATINYHTATDVMGEEGGDLIKRITSYAELRNNPGIYALAGLPSPAIPQPMPAPGTPMDFTAMLDQTGAVHLSWKCANPTGSQGTIYNISRQLGSNQAAPFMFIGAVGEKQFTDTTLPIGAGDGFVTYQVVATRSTLAGTPAVFHLKLGTTSGAVTITGTMLSDGGSDDGQMKLAA